MNKKRTVAVLLFLAALSMSMLMAPVGPMANAESASPPTLTPEVQDQVDEWYKTLEQPGYRATVDNVLAEWSNGGVLNDKVVTSPDGAVSALVFMAPWVEMTAVRDVVNVEWSVNLRAMRTALVNVPNVDALEALRAVDGVGAIQADQYRFDRPDDLVKNLDEIENPGIGVDMYKIKEVVKADDSTTYASGYTGDGVVVGHLDTGCDYGNPELEHTLDAVNYGAYDPSGEGVVPTFYHANSTVVNATEWLNSSYNLLTYVEDGKVMLDVSDWDP
ncbi:hypothetical protein EU546_00500, partial [Candidatus Thorarchaeota archaeon]